MYETDNRIVLTLDAGGTNFVFSAIKGYKEIVESLTLQAVSNNIDECLKVIVSGFEQIKAMIPENPVAISFAFPGPADYKNGVIGDLPNFKAFRGGVALGPFLQHKFNIPVYINNDGNLFAYGEALHGALPTVNKWLKESGNSFQYRNLLGLTLGTGFGAGVVLNNQLLTGDNGCGGDVWIMNNKKYPHLIVEDSVSIRAVKRVYAELSGTIDSTLTPKDIYEIAEGLRPGDKNAAIRSFEEMGEMAGGAIANASNIVDGIIVLGGGLTGASKYILPTLVAELNRNTAMMDGSQFPCLQMNVLNLEDETDRKQFLKKDYSMVKIPMSDQSVIYNNTKKTGVLVSQIGTNQAVMYGAYAYALQQIDEK